MWGVYIYVSIGAHVNVCRDLKSDSGIVYLEPINHLVFRHRVSHLPSRLSLRQGSDSLALALGDHHCAQLFVWVLVYRTQVFMVARQVPFLKSYLPSPE